METLKNLLREFNIFPKGPTLQAGELNPEDDSIQFGTDGGALGDEDDVDMGDTMFDPDSDSANHCDCSNTDDEGLGLDTPLILDSEDEDEEDLDGIQFDDTDDGNDLLFGLEHETDDPEKTKEDDFDFEF